MKTRFLIALISVGQAPFAQASTLPAKKSVPSKGRAAVASQAASKPAIDNDPSEQGILRRARAAFKNKDFAQAVKEYEKIPTSSVRSAISPTPA